ncbi:hypothetical protein NQ176_g637 [Zarea fungicola]|uniref:Uncharacterized protein n=1 Tax=Zarea fungicola TaxID=93591 RepID=A0ACC1NYY5_9HYPO|nr:hypothetical protein NQ176_g637 [Lecanicillium fungicola]
MHLRVVATSCSTGADNRCEWQVDIYIDDAARAGTSISLLDPLDHKERTLCRWYLDKFRQREPYSTSKAKAASLLLEKYGATLLSQLSLCQYVPDYDEVHIIVENQVEVDQRTSRSIHRLYWEFLEDERLWDTAGRVTVQRLVPHSKPGAQVPIQADQIDLLLITARDLTQKWTADSDISPSLVPDILCRIESALEPRGVILKIQIVRPGTLEALENTLRQNRLKNGRSFDIVHFDVHGAVAKDGNGQMDGFLYFNDGDTLETITVPAKTVAGLVGSYEIPAVVFNACDSASSMHGDKSNIAKIFLTGGSHNVLAMAHKASEDAVATFLESFYAAFLVHGYSFSKAAQVARSALRANPRRNARLNLEVAVTDWAIPVVYSTEDYDQHVLPHPTLGSSLPIKCTQAIRSSRPAEEVYGRDFDGMRLEKAISSNGLVHLYGAPGVGKSAFLSNVTKSWLRYGFTSIAVSVNFSSGNITTMMDLLWDISRQIGAQCDPGVEIEAILAETLINCLSRQRSVIVLDGFDYRSTNWQKQDQTMKSLGRFLSAVRAASYTKHGETSTYIIFSGRRPGDLARSALELGDIPEYELLGLSKPDAMSIVQMFAKPTSISAPEEHIYKDLRETWKAESLINLLQGNPAGLIQFCQLALNMNLSLPEMYNILHAEDPVLMLEINTLWPSFTLLHELHRKTQALTDAQLATWTTLAWYWHTGPLISNLQKILKNVDIVHDAALVEEAIAIAADTGYISTDSDGRISWIHPIFTISLRIMSCSSLCRVPSDKIAGWLGFRQGFASGPMRHLVAGDSRWAKGKQDGLDYATRLVQALLCSDITRDHHEPYWRFLIHILFDFNDNCRPLTRNLLSDGVNNPLLLSGCEVQKENYLLAVKLCRGRGPLPIPAIGWPAELVLEMGIFIIRLFNCDEVKRISVYYQEMLSGAVLQSQKAGGCAAVRSEDLGVVLGTVSFLIEMERRHIPGTTNRSMEFLRYGEKLLADSETQFGVSEVVSATLGKIKLSYAAGTVFMEERRAEESRERMKRANNLAQKLFETADPIDSDRVQQRLESTDPNDAAMLNVAIDEYKEMVIGDGGKMEQFWNVALAEALGQDLAADELQPQGGVWLQLHPVHEMFDSVLRNHSKIMASSHRLNLHEKELDRGHWARAMGYHTGALIRKVQQLDFEGVLETLDAQEDIARKHGVFDLHEKQFQVARDGIQHTAGWLSTVQSDSVTEEVVSEMTDYMASISVSGNKQGFPSELGDIAGLLKEAWVRDNDSNLPHTSAPGILCGNLSTQQGMIDIMTRHFSRAAHNRQYSNSFVAAVHKVLATVDQLERAEDESNAQDIYGRLDELEKLSQQDTTEEFINASKLPERRRWNTARLITDAIRNDHPATEDEAGLEQLFSKIGKAKQTMDLSKLSSTAEFESVAKEVEAQYQNIRLAVLSRRVSKSLAQNDKKLFVLHCKEILQLHGEGQFALALAKKSSKDCLAAVWAEYFRFCILSAFQDYNWQDARGIYAKWRAEDYVWQWARAEPGYKGVLAAEAACVSHAGLADVLDALERLDFARAKHAMDRSEKLSEKLERENENRAAESIRICMNRARTTTAEMLRTLGTQGPAAAKDLIARAKYAELVQPFG